MTIPIRMKVRWVLDMVVVVDMVVLVDEGKIKTAKRKRKGLMV